MTEKATILPAIEIKWKAYLGILSDLSPKDSSVSKENRAQHLTWDISSPQTVAVCRFRITVTFL